MSAATALLDLLSELPKMNGNLGRTPLLNSAAEDVAAFSLETMFVLQLLHFGDLEPTLRPD
jgi:hypothetical protein